MGGRAGNAIPGFERAGFQQVFTVNGTVDVTVVGKTVTVVYDSGGFTVSFSYRTKPSGGEWTEYSAPSAMTTGPASQVFDVGAFNDVYDLQFKIAPRESIPDIYGDGGANVYRCTNGASGGAAGGKEVVPDGTP